MCLRFTESNLSSFISHAVPTVCANNSQGALGSFSSTLEMFWSIQMFFFIASVEGFTHITEAKPNCGECCFWFPQFMKIHHIVWMCPLCSCWETKMQRSHRKYMCKYTAGAMRSDCTWDAWANWPLVTSSFHKCQWCNTVSPLLHLVPSTTGQVQCSQWDEGQRLSL